MAGEAPACAAVALWLLTAAVLFSLDQKQRGTALAIGGFAILTVLLLARAAYRKRQP